MWRSPISAKPWTAISSPTTIMSKVSSTSSARGTRAEPIVIHCYAGVSRSTAAAYITACALKSDADEAAIAQQLRRASPTATPNAHLVALADRILARDGRMSAAIKQIGRGADCFEAEPFVLELD